ncbi:hypothetical protein BC835DRAFT_1311785 [Cytidiella melzeri]|nr:hypothetical protein BC835DRAFT_1311785 [Cytidiella melzeri]
MGTGISVVAHKLTISVLLHQGLQHPFPFLLQDLVVRTRELHGVLYHRPESKYSAAIENLSHDRNLQFNISHARPQQIQDFRMEDMAIGIWEQQPMLWSLIYCLVTGEISRGNEEPLCATDLQEEAEENDEPEDHEQNQMGRGDDNDFPWRSRNGTRAKVFKEIKTVTVVSQLLHACYSKCNTLQSAMGIFLHSCNAPEKVIKVLARMGISVSLTSIHRAIHSLNSECFSNIRKLGCTLLVSYAYDNFDVKFSTGIPTAEGPKDTLVHLTSGTLIRLEHGVTVDDLRCSNKLWQKNPNNPHAANPIHFSPYSTFKFLYTLHSENDNRLRDTIDVPGAVDQIPVRKAHQVLLRAMDINQSTVLGNIDALLEMLAQASVDNADAISKVDEDMTDIEDVVQLIHGDLGTMERVLSAMDRRAIDLTPTARLQFVVFVFSLFHFKMAAADAIWRLLISPDTARKDPTSFMAFVGKLRPARTGKLTNNASFREQHELINHVGEVLRLDAWRVEAQRQGYLTLEKWAEAKPSLETIEKSAERIVSQYIEGEGINLYQMKNKSAAQRNKQHENTMRTHHYLLLYEELAYAMNKGDIGRVETLFQPWIQIFCAVGKHNYASRMLLFMHQLYHIYPEQAIRYNMLVNPTGRDQHFCAVDWVVELLNLFIKEIYGGKGSNYTKKRILDESALVLIYRNCHKVFKQNFLLSGLTYAHTTKNMMTTFHQHLAGRAAKYEIPNAMGRGAAIIASKGQPERVCDAQDIVMVDNVEEHIWDEIEKAGGGGIGDANYSELADMTMISAQDIAEGAL